MPIRLYQIDPSLDREGMRFRSFEETESETGGIQASRYREVFHGTVEAKDLEDVFEIFNRAIPDGFKGRSMSVSDVVLTEDEAGPGLSPGAYFCDVFGFQKADEFDPSLAKTQSEGIRMLALDPHRPPYVTTVRDSLEDLQAAVGGLIEITYPFEDNAIVIGNEEAKLIGMEGNRRIGGAIYAGPLLIAGDDGEGGTTDLTDEQIEKYTRAFLVPDEITREEVEADTGFRFIPFG